MSQMYSSLLPNGLKDLLPPEAEKESHITQNLLHSFSKFGYTRVKPPLVEFEQSLLSQGPGQALARQTFRLMDPVSGQMMGVRADTTAQIARIAKTRLADEPRPLRLSYAVDVLKVNGTQLRPERQFCQVGCEMIGVDDCSDDVEICLTALTALQKVGIKNLTIDLTIPSLVNDLYKAFDVKADEVEQFDKLLQKRERDELAGKKSEISQCLIGLLDASGVAETAIYELQKLKIPKAAQDTIINLKVIYDELSDALEIYGLDDVKITIDLIERRGFDYQNEISFTLFSSGVRGELGRGGRYRLNDDGNENAAGFTLYMDSLLYAATINPDRHDKSVATNCSWAEIKKLQDDGFHISRKK